MTVRPLLLLDLLTLFRLKLPNNKATTPDNLGDKETPYSLVGTFLGQWFLPRGRRITWVCTDNSGVQGLVSARSRHSPTVWQIDYLLLAVEKEEVCLALLDGLLAAGMASRVEKVFLRLADESPLRAAVQKAGFSVYANEMLFRLVQKGKEDWRANPTSHYHYRSKLSSDDYKLYQLYCTATPAKVRQAEGLTFGEWQRARDRNAIKGAKREIVYEKEDNLVAWLGTIAIGSRGQFDILVHPQEEWLGELVDTSLTYLKDRRYLLCLVPEFQGALSRILQARGFEEVARYTLSVKELTAKVRQPVPLPLQA